jgi:predicted Mrr-cat superfamily restriction endonuclease
MSGAVAVYERIRKTILIGKTTTTYFYRIAKTEGLRPKSFSGSSRN